MNTKRADQVLAFFANRGGFDQWWESIDESTQEDIRQELALLLSKRDDEVD